MFRILFIIVCSLFFAACIKGKDPECYQQIQSPVIDVYPTEDTVAMGQPIVFGVKVPVMNGCGSFNHFVEIDSSGIRTVIPMMQYAGCVCTQVYTEPVVEYQFLPPVPGNYTFRFKDTANYAMLFDVTVTP